MAQKRAHWNDYAQRTAHEREIYAALPNFED